MELAGPQSRHLLLFWRFLEDNEKKLTFFPSFLISSTGRFGIDDGVEHWQTWSPQNNSCFLSFPNAVFTTQNIFFWGFCVFSENLEVKLHTCHILHPAEKQRRWHQVVFSMTFLAVNPKSLLPLNSTPLSVYLLKINKILEEPVDGGTMSGTKIEACLFRKGCLEWRIRCTGCADCAVNKKRESKRPGNAGLLQEDEE